jgi:hypothetical protein
MAVLRGSCLTATVKNKQVVFPGGAAYQLLVLPAYASMTPALLAKIGELVKQGATVVGNPPLRSPSLVDYPDCDRKVLLLSKTIWGATDQPAEITHRRYGKGEVIWGGAISKKIDHLYPFYEETARILQAKGLREDFLADGPVRYTHRTNKNFDLYFVANTTDKPIKIKAQFRTVKGAPELWNAVTGKITPLYDFEVDKNQTVLPLQLAAYESCFVLFAAENKWAPYKHHRDISFNTLLALEGAWEVHFDPKWGGPAQALFRELSDWTKNSEEGIKYYSGIAAYHKKFDLTSGNLRKGAAPLYLDLGKIKNMARIMLNGKDLGVLWTAPWRIDISGAVKEKNNELIIEVANLWPNRLIGDEKKPFDGVVNDQWPEWLLKNQPRTSGRYTFTSYQPYKADTPLFESGLMGPVTIVQEVIQ